MKSMREMAVDLANRTARDKLGRSPFTYECKVSRHPQMAGKYAGEVFLRLFQDGTPRYLAMIREETGHVLVLKVDAIDVLS